MKTYQAGDTCWTIQAPTSGKIAIPWHGKITEIMPGFVRIVTHCTTIEIPVDEIFNSELDAWVAYRESLLATALEVVNKAHRAGVIIEKLRRNQNGIHVQEDETC